MAYSAVQNSSAVTLEDCTCPICMSILIQPVTMPCTHELCMPCFRKTVEEANLCCPMCRLRIATWARLSTKQKTLVNEIRWKQIQTLFPEKVRRRQEGKDDDDGDLNDEDEPIHHPIVNIAEPGEIRKEYEEQLERLEKQREEERSKEEAESADLIKKLQREEEERARELERQAEEQRIKDEEIARKLAESAEVSVYL
ncbi:hypothetical protein LOTGIDRAFT_141101 [Lottia gigantea]|uniref:RING-type E3 ubiquitin transferase n=1 Tax=Lottia gigantea TaxID=225164 RepID=V4ASJ5_LOTGI|nr:hypothetical protein LOTGIDRAFT_141101 [Lottia gigantea]ESP00248.1 hypothetical protein LOTGIDRAFT_141101 [Lottia gigantea]